MLIFLLLATRVNSTPLKPENQTTSERTINVLGDWLNAVLSCSIRTLGSVFLFMSKLYNKPAEHGSCIMNEVDSWTFRCIRCPCIIPPPLMQSSSVFTSDANEDEVLPPFLLLYFLKFCVGCFLWFQGCFLISHLVCNACFLFPFGLLKCIFVSVQLQLVCVVSVLQSSVDSDTRFSQRIICFRCGMWHRITGCIADHKVTKPSDPESTASPPLTPLLCLHTLSSPSSPERTVNLTPSARLWCPVPCVVLSFLCNVSKAVWSP